MMTPLTGEVVRAALVRRGFGAVDVRVLDEVAGLERPHCVRVHFQGDLADGEDGGVVDLGHAALAGAVERGVGRQVAGNWEPAVPAGKEHVTGLVARVHVGYIAVQIRSRVHVPDRHILPRCAAAAAAPSRRFHLLLSQ